MFDYHQVMRFVARFVVQTVALIAVVVFAVFFFNGGSDVNDEASQPSATSSTSTDSGSSSKYGAVSLVGGADYDLDAVVAARPVVFWFWAPG